MTPQTRPIDPRWLPVARAVLQEEGLSPEAVSHFTPILAARCEDLLQTLLECDLAPWAEDQADGLYWQYHHRRIDEALGK